MKANKTRLRVGAYYTWRNMRKERKRERENQMERERGREGESITQYHNYMHKQLRGKVISLYVSCRQHENGPIWTFRHLSEL